jgi:hypothetical protein
MEKVIVEYKTDTTPLYVHDKPSDFVSMMIHKKRTFYESDLLDFLLRKYPAQKNMVDVGANIGNHSLFFVKYMKCAHVFAFEPIAENVNVFQANLKAYTRKCTLFEQALSDHRGSMQLYNTQADDFGGFSLHQEEKSINVAEIEVKPLDDFGLTDVTLIKIDVENHENEVLRGAKRTIEENRPVIVLENSYYYQSRLFPDPNPHAEVLESYGYKRVHSNVCSSAMDVWEPV